MDLQQAFDAGFDAVKRYVDSIADQVEERLIAVEKSIPKDGRDGIDGKDGADGRNGADGRDGIDGANGADGVNGKDGTNGRDGANGLDGKDGKDGRDVDMDAVRSMVAELVAEAVAGIRVPADGRDGKDGADGINGKDGIDGLNGKDGADGIGLVAAVQNADGQLIITDTKGGVHNVGVVRGVNGADGRDGSNGANGSNGTDGLHGKDGLHGRDGFGFEDMDMVETDEGFVLRFSREGVTKDFRVPVPLDRGTFKDGQSYRKGDGVSFGGSFWIAQEDTTDKPETGKGWRLAVKRGRDGREGAPGERGADGKPGAPGRDLTQLGMDGSKW